MASAKELMQGRGRSLDSFQELLEADGITSSDLFYGVGHSRRCIVAKHPVKRQAVFDRFRCETTRLICSDKVFLTDRCVRNRASHFFCEKVSDFPMVQCFGTSDQVFPRKSSGQRFSDGRSNIGALKPVVKLSMKKPARTKVCFRPESMIWSSIFRIGRSARLCPENAAR